MSAEHIKEMWGSPNIMSDYWSKPHKTEDPEERLIQEVYGDPATINKVKKPTDQWQFRGNQEHLET